MGEQEKFLKRKGTSADHGHKYEKLLCLRIVQWLEENKKEYKLANNVDNFGEFDDIVCKIEESDSDFHWFVQAKHAMNDKTLTIGGNEYNLKSAIKSMFKSYVKITNHLKTDISNSKRPYKCEFAYVTNRKVDLTISNNVDLVQTFDNKFSINSVLGGKGKCYEIKNFANTVFHKELKNEDVKLVFEFFKHFRIYVEQYNNDWLECLIKKDMQKQYPYRDSEVDNLFWKLESEISEWFKLEQSVHYITSRMQVFFTKQLFYYQNQLTKFFEAYDMLEFNQKFLEHIYDTLEKNKIICRNFKTEFLKVETTLCLQFVQYFCERKNISNNNVAYVHETMDMLLFEKFFSQEGSMFKLIVGILGKSKSSIVSKLQELAKKLVDTKILILCEEPSEICLTSIPSFSFAHLSPKNCEDLLNKNIKFQGNDLALSEVIGCDMHDLISVSMISNFYQNKTVKIGEELEDLGDIKHYYMQRDFILKDSIALIDLFKDCEENECFCFLGLNKNKNLEAVPGKFEFLNDMKEFKRNCFKYKSKNIHLFEKKRSGLKYIQTKGSKHVLQTNLLIGKGNSLSILQKKFIDMIICSKNRFICISDIPGNGKSVMLQKLSLELKEKYKENWVVLINLTLLKNTKMDCKSTENVISVLTECLGYDDENTKQFFYKLCLLPEKIIVLLDAFDEVSPSYQNKVDDLLTALKDTQIKKVILATRPHCLKAIQTILNPIPLQDFSMTTFSENVQKIFIQKYWEQELSRKNITYNTQFVMSCVDKLVIHVNKLEVHGIEQVTGVPLLIKIFAESYITELKKGIRIGHFEITDQFLNLESIYHKFVTEKFNILFEEKYNIKDEILLNDFSMLKKNSTMVSHSYMAVREIFSKKIVDKFFEENISAVENDKPERTGIVLKKEKNYMFIHRTFAEYFCALKLLLHLTSVCDCKFVDFVNFFLSEILVCDEYKVIRKFVNENIFSSNVQMFSTQKYYFFLKKSNNKVNILHHLSNERLDNIYKWLEQSIAFNENKDIFYSTLLNMDANIEFQVGNIKNKQDKNVCDSIEHPIELYNELDETNLCKKYDSVERSNFQRALQDGHVSIVKTMIESNSECLKYTFEDGMSALDLVINDIFYNRQEEMIELLLQKGATFHKENEPLNASIKNAFEINVIDLLVEHGEDVHKTESDGMSLLMHAANEHRLDLVELLITKYNFDVNKLCNSKNSALFYAVIRSEDFECHDIYEYFAKAKIFVDKKIKTIQYLLEKGAIVDLQTVKKAIHRGTIKTVELLLLYGPDVAKEIKDSDINSIFEYFHSKSIFYYEDITSFITRFHMSESERIEMYRREITELLNKHRN